MKRFLAVLVLAMLVMSLFVGCGSSKSTGTNAGTSTITYGMYKDGEYQAKSDPDQYGNYAEIKIKVEGGSITLVDWKEYAKDGKEKSETYGKESGKDDDYNKAQYALSASRSYGSILQSVQDPNKVDVISGSSVSHKLFQDLANKALKDAKK